MILRTTNPSSGTADALFDEKKVWPDSVHFWQETCLITVEGTGDELRNEHCLTKFVFK